MPEYVVSELGVVGGNVTGPRGNNESSNDWQRAVHKKGGSPCKTEENYSFLAMKVVNNQVVLEEHSNLGRSVETGSEVGGEGVKASQCEGEGSGCESSCVSVKKVAVKKEVVSGRNRKLHNGNKKVCGRVVVDKKNTVSPLASAAKVRNEKKSKAEMLCVTEEMASEEVSVIEDLEARESGNERKALSL